MDHRTAGTSIFRIKNSIGLRYAMRNFVICSPLQMLLGRWNQK